MTKGADAPKIQIAVCAFSSVVKGIRDQVYACERSVLEPADRSALGKDDLKYTVAKSP